jgi:glycosyltransferase involved in cell wall biosynthesis
MLLTVLTTTYNSDKTLQRVYACLNEQSDMEFEWIVVDDGSTDSTKELVEQWKSEAPFRICYHLQANKGIPSARNQGYSMASGDYCFTLDADDEISANAIEVMKRRVSQVEALANAHDIGVIEFLCVDQNGNMVGPDFPNEGQPYRLKDIFYKNKIKSERIKLAKKEVYTNFRYKENPPRRSSSANELFWFPIGDKWMFIGFNDRLRIYHRNVDGQMSARIRKSFFKYAESNLDIVERAFLNDFHNYAKHDSKRFASYAATIIALKLHLKESCWAYLSKLSVSQKMFFLCCAPIGYLRLKWRQRTRTSIT